MERLNKNAPTKKLTDAQKKQLAELDSKYAAKIASRRYCVERRKSQKPPDDFSKEESLPISLRPSAKNFRLNWKRKRSKFDARNKILVHPEGLEPPTF